MRSRKGLFRLCWERVRRLPVALVYCLPWLAGRVLQALVGAQERLAVGAVVVHILQGIYAEWDEAAASNTSQQAQAATGEPGEGSGIVGQLGHDHLAAGRTAHLDRAVIEGDGLLHINGLHGNYRQKTAQLLSEREVTLMSTHESGHTGYPRAQAHSPKA